MCISVSLSGFVVLGCMFAPKVHIIMFQPQKNVISHRLNLNRFSVSGAATTYASHGRLHAVTSFLKRQGLDLHSFFIMSLPKRCFQLSVFNNNRRHCSTYAIWDTTFFFFFKYLGVCFLYISGFVPIEQRRTVLKSLLLSLQTLRFAVMRD